jgi:hypothetical protein
MGWMAQLCSNWLKVANNPELLIVFPWGETYKHYGILWGVDKRFKQGLRISTGICYINTRIRILGIRVRIPRREMQYGIYFRELYVTRR